MRSSGSRNVHKNVSKSVLRSDSGLTNDGKNGHLTIVRAMIDRVKIVFPFESLGDLNHRRGASGGPTSRCGHFAWK
jgi:hypothetical protein